MSGERALFVANGKIYNKDIEEEIKNDVAAIVERKQGQSIISTEAELLMTTLITTIENLIK